MAKAGPVAGLNPTASLRQNAQAIVVARSYEMFSFSEAIGDPTRDEDLHNMRIAAKRLRYTLEMFRVVLNSDGETLITSVKELQERIGNIHDGDVLALIVRRRLAVAAQQRVEAMASYATTGDEDKRIAHIHAAMSASNDPQLGLALLLARTLVRRENDFAALTRWWAEQDDNALEARLATVVGLD